jgi:multicomponent Na+:H+ antiporter subunit B
MRRILRVMIDAAALLAIAAMIALAIAPEPGSVASADDDGVRTHILQSGTEETGSFNLVTAIYLGYRAYDTLGETVVLLLSVSGVVYLVSRKS